MIMDASPLGPVRRRDRQLAVRALVRVQRFAGVADEIQHQLLQLDAVAVHRRQARAEAGRDFHVARHEIAVRELEHFAQQVVQVDRRELVLAFLHQHAQPLDHVAGALVGLDDLAQDAADLGEVDVLEREEALRRPARC